MTAVMVEMAAAVITMITMTKKSSDPYGGDTNSNGNGSTHGDGWDDYNSKGDSRCNFSQLQWQTRLWQRQKRYYAPFMGYKFIAYLCP